MKLALTIVSPEKTLFEGGVEIVKVPGGKGPFEILYNHAPIISNLVKGNVSYGSAEQMETLAIHSGFVKVEKNKVTLCVTSIE